MTPIPTLPNYILVDIFNKYVNYRTFYYSGYQDSIEYFLFVRLHLSLVSKGLRDMVLPNLVFERVYIDRFRDLRRLRRVLDEGWNFKEIILSKWNENADFIQYEEGVIPLERFKRILFYKYNRDAAEIDDPKSTYNTMIAKCTNRHLLENWERYWSSRGGQELNLDGGYQSQENFSNFQFFGEYCKESLSQFNRLCYDEDYDEEERSEKIKVLDSLLPVENIRSLRTDLSQLINKFNNLIDLEFQLKNEYGHNQVPAKEIIGHPGLRSVSIISTNKNNIECASTIVDILNSRKNLTKLHLIDLEFEFDIPLDYSISCGSLRELAIRKSTRDKIQHDHTLIDNLFFFKLKNISLPSLKRLDIRSIQNTIPSDFLDLLIQRFPVLEHLAFTLQRENILSLSNLLMNSQTLVSLSIEINTVHQESYNIRDYSVLCKAITSNRLIKHLKLQVKAKSTGEEKGILFYLLSLFPENSLETLSVIGSDIAERVLAILLCKQSLIKSFTLEDRTSSTELSGFLAEYLTFHPQTERVLIKWHERIDKDLLNDRISKILFPSNSCIEKRIYNFPFISIKDNAIELYNSWPLYREILFLKNKIF